MVENFGFCVTFTSTFDYSVSFTTLCYISILLFISKMLSSQLPVPVDN